MVKDRQFGIAEIIYVFICGLAELIRLCKWTKNSFNAFETDFRRRRIWKSAVWMEEGQAKFFFPSHAGVLQFGVKQQSPWTGWHGNTHRDTHTHLQEEQEKGREDIRSPATAQAGCQSLIGRRVRRGRGNIRVCGLHPPLKMSLSQGVSFVSFLHYVHQRRDVSHRAPRCLSAYLRTVWAV